PHPPKPRVHEPIIRVHEKRLQRKPHARHALLINETRRAHRAVRVGRVAEIQEKLVSLAELPTGEKEAFLAVRRTRRATTNVDHDREIGENDGEIEKVQAAEAHKEKEEGAVTRSPQKNHRERKGVSAT